MHRDGEDGRKKIKHYHAICDARTGNTGKCRSCDRIRTVRDCYLTSAPLIVAEMIVCLTAGAVFVMWLGEQITDKGIGNGISIIPSYQHCFPYAE